MEIQGIDWNKDALRALRLRMGWCKSDLARRLNCTMQDVDAWEAGRSEIADVVISELEFLLRQADMYCEQMKAIPVAESSCEQNALEQIEFSRVIAELE